ncbi:class I adenylate-forming enzyme family protein [Natrinema altunense]|uniref:O-succinylbenzoate--CoA ligase n=1 Tax=Natrinema altunense (strain JCM 12890 / CGMCC 1.3731 / AJ2) TaxID=1227494 RepID=L9ZTM2_NATA2|nr:class I adenylate-forming enzyme family protein [Natrinema altunense]ELY88508.1 o-succinylbenzoate--CoA ligase [Natrinema altunense JCM 12890]
MTAPVDWPTRDLLSHRTSTTPDETALIDADSGQTWTYGEFDRRVDAVTERLETVVSGPDDRLGVLMGTRVAFAEIYFAAMRRGVTVVPLNVRETAAELESKATRTALDAIVCESETEALALDIADCPVVSVDSPEHDGVESLQPVTEASTTPVPLERKQTQLLMFTSGTAGEPKAVRLTVGNLVASATASAFRLGVGPDDRWLCCLPMYHMGGLAPVVRSTLYGTTAVLQREFDPRETARIIDDEDITGVSLVPTMCKRLLDAGWTPPATLRFVLLGGAPASSDLLERCRERGVPVCPTYGMTETASQIATALPDGAAAHEGTVGQPLMFTDVTVVDETGAAVEPGEQGELVVSGPTVTPGYLDADETAAAFGDHGLHTGDVGYRDEGGRLWILNRRSDRIVTGGENVDPGEVVAALRDHPRVDDAAVVGLADEEWGERVAALVVPESGTAGSLESRSLLAHCDERLAGFKRPKTVGVVDALPRTASGTVDREAVRERLREDGTDVTDAA